MKIELSEQQFRYLLDLVYIGNWVINSTRENDRIQEYDQVESLVFSHCLRHKMSKLVELYRGELIPSRAFADGGIHEAIEQYEDVVFYEILAEGGITRMMAVFQDGAGAGEIGTVRSARDYYASLAYGHDAVYLHAGGSPQAYEFIKSRGVTALDCVNGPYEGTLFWRDQERRRSAGLEHSVLTSSETIQELLPTYQRVRLDHEEGFQVGWTFQEGPEAGGEAAEILTVPFSTYKTGVFEYDPDSGLYLVEEYGEPYVDGNTGEQVAVKNVLVLYTDVSQLSGDSAGRLKVRTTGSGGGLLVRDGLAWPITWEREGESDRLSFYREDGQPAALGVGHSYINIVKTGTEVTWAAKSPEEAG